ncbi:LysR family transcriptional regulator [Burkholderia thailandensis]|uniref:LysR family transcriptional regulator n=1 Tax=Burkholderia thailandensis TaxID=57975 RepID=UPI0012E6F821|nr:LysR family transcriptional regulator [Burkholderia thailandensis]MCS6471885.1 LysR family transcriptional regulator [Burkholderia thailandensis]MCS6480206.1 LysR family transcriptional regulator [Burkholderia thailandensis]MCS6500368.1 LysR family transcriptional regulator [Burkholderia thailandensis]MUV20347.1 LysR family transcriptional regulator [Burkholderia thailandensis]
MARSDLSDIVVFLAVAREGSFTKAAAKLGVSQSALSQTVRNVEARLGLRLLTRTTRKISPTQAGERLIQSVGPRLDEIEAELSALSALRDTPAGVVRIAAGEHAADLLLWPVIERLLPDYPDITIEIVIDNGLTDIVEQRLDAGVRLGEQVAKDMVAVRIGPDVRMVVVGTPAYFARYAEPKTPQDLMAHNCINIRLPTAGGIYAWEFRKSGRELNVRVEGQLVFNTATMAVKAALAGVGLAFVPEQRVLSQLESGELIRVLAEWCPSFSGFHLYYPSRRQPTPAFVVVANALREGARALESDVKRKQ